MKTFLISRTDAIGDVVLTLPLAGWIKSIYPDAKVIFLGRTYTQPVVACSRHVDAFLNADELLKLPVAGQVAALRKEKVSVFLHVFPDQHLAWLAKNAGIPERVGTRNRWYHLLTCNKLVALSRRKSDLHESQLNLLLLKGEGVPPPPPLQDLHLYYGFDRIPALPPRLRELLVGQGGLNLILHPKSKGHGREWSLPKFGELARRLKGQGHRVFVTGSAQEKEVLHTWIRDHQESVTDLTGQMSLPEFISFIAAADGLVASGTGPLHLAAAAGTNTLGLYPPMRPVYPGRWAPVGERATFLVVPKACVACRKTPTACLCIEEIPVEAVLGKIAGWRKRTI
jgi:heptosyltransferase III